MPLQSTDDLKDLPHVVIIESDAPATLQMAEFERGEAGYLAAHAYAQSHAMKAGIRRILVTARYRQMGNIAAIANAPS